MKAMVGVVAIACAVGCSMDTVQTTATHQAITGDCTDPDAPCRLRNGVGVYTEEDGNGHIGAEDFMIMRFINQSGGGVALKGRGALSNGDYGMSMGTVDSAWYGGVSYPVDSVDETLTEPTFNLVRPNGTAFAVSPLDITLVVTAQEKRVALKWFLETTEQVRGPSGQLMHEFGMRWSYGDTYSAAQSMAYCHTADGSIDKVVFQRGIGVQPLTAVVARNSSFVTLSCRGGAIATARYWGYAYRGDQAQSDMFEAAMHMKRASFCGDINDYTESGTIIKIRDNVGIEQDQFSPSEMEASWGRGSDGAVHALCMSATPNNYRHPELLPSPFDRTCNGALPPIPDCPMPTNNGYGPLADTN